VQQWHVWGGSGGNEQRQCRVRSEEEKRGLASMKAHGQRWIRMANA
jgi:hypothetical protein